MPPARATGSRTRKTLSFFRVNFGHAPPYEVLCDGPTIFQSLNNDLYLKQSLPKLLGGPAYPVVTECVVKELRGLGEAYANAALFAKRVKRMSCVHEGEASVAECLASLLRNQSETKLVLATNDSDVVAKVARIPGVPIISILNERKFVLKAPSAATVRFVQDSEKVKTSGLSGPDMVLVNDVKEAERQLLEKRVGRKKRKRAKGPNPLSVKKPKVIREKSGLKQSGSSQSPRSTVSPNDPLVPDTRNGEADALNTKRTADQEAEIKLRQSDVDSPDNGGGNRKRIRQVGEDSCEFSDFNGKNASKDMGGTAKKVSSSSRVTPKSRTKRRRNKEKAVDIANVATKTAENLSRTLNPMFAHSQAEGSSTFKNNLGSVEDLSPRRGAGNVATRTPESDQGPSDHDSSVETERHAVKGSPQPLDDNPVPKAVAPEPSEDKFAKNDQVKRSNCDERENCNKDKSRGSMDGRKNIACDTGNKQLREIDQTQGAGEGDKRTTSTGGDGEKKKKQRKNRRRRPKKKGAD